MRLTRIERLVLTAIIGIGVIAAGGFLLRKLRERPAVSGRWEGVSGASTFIVIILESADGKLAGGGVLLRAPADRQPARVVSIEGVRAGNDVQLVLQNSSEPAASAVLNFLGHRQLEGLLYSESVPAQNILLKRK